jgi:hypothetical protein
VQSPVPCPKIIDSIFKSSHQSLDICGLTSLGAYSNVTKRATRAREHIYLLTCVHTCVLTHTPALHLVTVPPGSLGLSKSGIRV